MDYERLIGSAATGILTSFVSFTGVALYDGVIRFPDWKDRHGGHSFVFYETPEGKTVAEQMRPSFHLYVALPVGSAVLGAAGFMFAHPRQREPRTTNLMARVNPTTQ
jgi:hypothetical protein